MKKLFKFVFGIFAGLLLSILALFLLFSFLPLSYHVNRYYMSDGNREIIFQEMVHIGNKEFYDMVADDIIKYNKDGYVYYYEGVASHNKNSSDFDKKLFSKNNVSTDATLGDYRLLTSLESGLMIQPYYNKLDVKKINADISMEELSNYLDTVPVDNSPSVEIKKEDIINHISWLKSLPLPFLYILQHFNKNCLILSLKKTKFNDRLSDVLLNTRNKVLLNYTINGKDSKIFITYGQAHFKGFYQLLREKDKTITIDYIEKVKIL